MDKFLVLPLYISCMENAHSVNLLTHFAFIPCIDLMKVLEPVFKQPSTPCSGRQSGH